MSNSSAAKNLEVIVAAMDIHEVNCGSPLVAVMMNPFEVDRLGWDEIKGVPIRSDEKLGTGQFNLLCSGLEQEEEAQAEVVEAVPAERELQPV